VSEPGSPADPKDASADAGSAELAAAAPAPSSADAAPAPPPSYLALLDGDIAFSAIPMPKIGAPPPTEYLAFKWGDNPTTKGIKKLTPEGARMIMDDYRARGNIQYIDLWHSTWDDKVRPEDKKSVGQYRLELDAQGLWYRGIQYAPQTAEEIRNGNWLFFSPAIKNDKNGVITQHLNAALVNYPGTINAVPTILSDISQEASTTMADDKKRMVLDAYSALESAMKRCQTLSSTDGAEKDLGNAATGSLAAMMDKFRGHMGTGGYLDDATMSAKRLDGLNAVLSDIEQHFKESDPVKLQAKVMTLLMGAPSPAVPADGSISLSTGDQAGLKKLLLDGFPQKYPAAQRSILESKPLGVVVTFLSGASDIVPKQPVREAAPLAPTAANVEKQMPDNQDGKNYTSLSAADRAKVDSAVDFERRVMGKDFNEQLARDNAMALLSDVPKDLGDRSRYLPMEGNQAPVVTISGPR
jgi:hypothetical protein